MESRFSVVPPDKALPSLIVQEKEAISEREKIADGWATNSPPSSRQQTPLLMSLIQVIRSPRGVAERYQRLNWRLSARLKVSSRRRFS